MINRKTKLAKAVTMALAGAAFSVGAISTASAASTTMYNTFTAGGLGSSTDGWTRTTGPASNGNTGPIQAWVGTTGSALPDVYGGGSNNGAYSGSSHLNWAARIGSVGDSAEISAADSTARYAPGGSSPDTNYVGPAEIDTGAGAWQDDGPNSARAVPYNVDTGWKHQTDIGLISTAQNMWVTLKPSVLAGGDPDFVGNFGITVFTGADTNTGNYSHHGAWNNVAAVGSSPISGPHPLDMDNPFGTSGVLHYTHDDTVDSVNGLTFYALANQTYSIYLGGAGVGQWSQNLANYKLDITTSAVPVPAAVWLFGSALAGMGIIGRRQDKAKMVA